MIPNTIIKHDYSEAVAQWVKQGKQVKTLNGFNQVQHKQPKPCRIKQKPMGEPLDFRRAEFLQKWASVEHERLEKLAKFLGISMFMMLQIQSQQEACSRQRWSAILKFIEGYGA